MPWWVWALLVWGALALALGVVIGRAIRMADARELGRKEVRPHDEKTPPEGRHVP